MFPWLHTEKEITDDNGNRHLFDTIRSNRSWILDEPSKDIDEVDLYSDYGGGFYWRGTGSESERFILSELAPLNDWSQDVTDGVPNWVSDFLTE